MKKEAASKAIAREISVLGNTRIRQATRHDHKTLVKLANMSPFTSSFSSNMFSAEAAYEKGWIRVAVYGSDIVALTCVRHKVREPKTVLYFLIVHPHMRGQEIGKKMLKDLEQQSPHKCLKFNVSKSNPDARKFYVRHGYTIKNSDAMQGTGWTMERSWS